MNSRDLVPLLLLTVSCSSEPKCEETFSCGAQQVAANSGSGNRGDSGYYLQDSGIVDSGAGGTQGGGAGANSGGRNGSGGNTGNGNGGEDGIGETEGDGGNFVLCGSTRGTGCTPSQQNAVFVDASASDGGDGSRASPLSSIVAALALAKDTAATDIYICAGNYDESVLITDDEAGTDLHGGFLCEGFTYDADAVPAIQPSSGDYALHIDGLTSAILFEHLAFSSVNADEPGESSIAVFVSESTDVTFEHCQFGTGDGVDGTPGLTEDFIEGVDWPTASSLDGHSGTSTVGGASTGEITCPDTTETTWGGKGGEITTGSTDGEDGGPVGRGGAGQQAVNCLPITEDGNFGAPGLDGEPGAAAGLLTSSGFVPNAGEDGSVGKVGGGGGGGTGSDDDTPLSYLGGGGGGGAGGCGGNYGHGGQGGGASVALLVYDSMVTLYESSLISGNAGSGGSGSFGQEGQDGGSGGSGDLRGCSGGDGAGGGDGGNGGGGAGGISVGVLWTGATEPQLDQATTDAITVGMAADDGNGAAGFAAAVHQL